jgi:RNase P subunit RPR2
VFCENCTTTTICLSKTIRLTKDGREITIERCENCLSLQETEYVKGCTVQFKKAQNPVKRLS